MLLHILTSHPCFNTFCPTFFLNILHILTIDNSCYQADFETMLPFLVRFPYLWGEGEMGNLLIGPKVPFVYVEGVRAYGIKRQDVLGLRARELR